MAGAVEMTRRQRYGVVLGVCVLLWSMFAAGLTLHLPQVMWAAGLGFFIVTGVLALGDLGRKTPPTPPTPPPPAALSERQLDHTDRMLAELGLPPMPRIPDQRSEHG